jgi:hypothetical protein
LLFLLEKLDLDLLLEDGTSKIQEIFQGMMCYYRRCKVCNRVHQKEDLFQTLDLSLVGFTADTSVSHLLSEYTSTKDDGEKSLCENCLVNVDTETEIEITQYPKVLLICLKRYSPEKNDVAIIFDSLKVDDVDYEMKAFVSHIGTNPTAGHYIATISFGGKFLLLSDQDITVLDNIISSSDCYIAVYQKSVQNNSMILAESLWIEDFKQNSTLRKLQRSDTLPIIPERIQSNTEGVRSQSNETINPFSQQKSFDKLSSIENYSQENRDAAVGEWYEEIGWEDEDIDYNQFWDDYHHLDVEVSVSDIIFPPKTVLIL